MRQPFIPDYPFPEHDTMDTPKPGSLIVWMIAEITAAIFIAWMLYAAADVAREFSFDEVARHSENFSSYRTANGGGR